jgi:hypothetical protein
MCSFQQYQRIRGWNRFFPEARGYGEEEMAQIMYAHGVIVKTIK